MGVFADWFVFKSAKQRAREEKQFARWAFPYGDAQQEKVKEVIRQLLPKEDPRAGMAVFLIGREAYRGAFNADPEDLAERTEEEKMEDLDRTLDAQLFGCYRKYIPYYKALILSDLDVDETLNYPSTEELRRRAQELMEK